MSLFCALFENYQHFFENNIFHPEVSCLRHSKMAIYYAQWFLSYWSDKTGKKKRNIEPELMISTHNLRQTSNFRSILWPSWGDWQPRLEVTYLSDTIDRKFEVCRKLCVKIMSPDSIFWVWENLRYVANYALRSWVQTQYFEFEKIWGMSQIMCSDHEFRLNIYYIHQHRWTFILM